MDGVQDIRAESFDSEVKESAGSVVLELWIRSCDVCRKFKPVYEGLPKFFPDVKFLRMNMMKSIENLRLAEGMGVEVTPTTKVFCGGSEVGEIVGYRSLDDAVAEIEAIIKECP